MTFSRLFTVTARVVRQVSMGIEVVLNPGAGWPYAVIFLILEREVVIFATFCSASTS